VNCHSVTTVYCLQDTNKSLAYNIFTKCRYFLIVIAEGAFCNTVFYNPEFHCYLLFYLCLSWELEEMNKINQFLTPMVALCVCVKKLNEKLNETYWKLTDIFRIFMQNLIWTITFDVCRFSLIWWVKLRHRKLLKTAWRKKKILQLNVAVRFCKIKE